MTVTFGLECGCVIDVFSGRPVELPTGSRWDRAAYEAIYRHRCPERTMSGRS